MHLVTRLARLDQVELLPYGTLRRQEDHRRQGVFVAEGQLVVERLLASPLEVVSLLATPRWLEQIQTALDQRRESLRIFLAEAELLAEIVGYHAHQGLMALARVPPQPRLPELLENRTQPALLLALEGVANPENIGVIVRSAASFGVSALIVGETAADPWLRRAVRNSMGAIFHLPVIRVSDLAATLSDLQLSYGIQAFAACPREGAPLWRADLTRECCFVLGHEGCGLRPQVTSACGGLITIPMSPGPDSLNVAGAAAVLLYEANRQRLAGNAPTP